MGYADAAGDRLTEIREAVIEGDVQYEGAILELFALQIGTLATLTDEIVRIREKVNVYPKTRSRSMFRWNEWTSTWKIVLAIQGVTRQIAALAQTRWGVHS